MMYLIRTEGENNTQQREDAFYPPGYPGQLAEAAFQMDIWDSAINTLSDDGLADPDRVGIIGFSRSGWFTEFILTHSKHSFRAATATDNVQYSMGSYWLLHTDGAMLNSDTVMGGPPYGDTRKTWIDHSISFNLEKIHTPLLMEEMGYGVHDDRPGSIPETLALSYEVFAGLNRLRKPVELYYYPDENHLPDHPRARLASLQRNVDWYRFWLLGTESADPADPGRNERWQRMKVEPRD
jgi:dipeptidyl aminopeptidase/acylaminoacyl peptidase